MDVATSEKPFETAEHNKHVKCYDCYHLSHTHTRLPATPRFSLGGLLCQIVALPILTRCHRRKGLNQSRPHDRWIDRWILCEALRAVTSPRTRLRCLEETGPKRRFEDYGSASGLSNLLRNSGQTQSRADDVVQASSPLLDGCEDLYLRL